MTCSVPLSIISKASPSSRWPQCKCPRVVFSALTQRLSPIPSLCVSSFVRRRFTGQSAHHLLQPRLCVLEQGRETLVQVKPLTVPPLQSEENVSPCRKGALEARSHGADLRYDCPEVTPYFPPCSVSPPHLASGPLTRNHGTASAAQTPVDNLGTYLRTTSRCCFLAEVPTRSRLPLVTMALTAFLLSCLRAERLAEPEPSAGGVSCWMVPLSTRARPEGCSHGNQGMALLRTATDGCRIFSFIQR